MRKERLFYWRENPRTYSCRRCSAEFRAFVIGRHWYCKPCRLMSYEAARWAKVWVARAMRSGVLMHANQHRCVDCGEWATGWEHRDYAKPLAVDPTCSSCNFKRGPAKFGPVTAEMIDEVRLLAAGSQFEIRYGNVA
jgi:hypothetical protein